MTNFYNQDDDLTHYFRRLRRGRVGRISQGHKPIYHLTMKKINRSSGRSVVSAVAYASGRKLTDSRGNEFDYSKKDEAIYSELLLPEGAPKEYQNRIHLWHAVEKIERRKDAVICKTIELSLPREFSLDDIQTAIRELLKETVDKGYCADWSIHDKDGHNPHVHIVLTTRKLVNGKWQQKVKSRYVLDDKGNRIPVIDPTTGKQKIGARGRKMWKCEKTTINEVSTKEFLTGIRKRWEDVANSMLPDDKKIDSRSYKDRGLEIMPTIHEGYYSRHKLENSTKQQINRLLEEKKKTLNVFSVELEKAQNELNRLRKERTNIFCKKVNNRRKAQEAQKQKPTFSNGLTEENKKLYELVLKAYLKTEKFVKHPRLVKPFAETLKRLFIEAQERGEKIEVNRFMPSRDGRLQRQSKPQPTKQTIRKGGMER